MKYIEGFMDFCMDRDTAVTLGKFDGLHRGHQELIRRVCKKEDDGLAAVVVTIWPDPKASALMTLGEKKERLQNLGVSWWIDCPFLPQIAQMPAEEFVREILVKRLRAKYIAVGSDFQFGCRRSGDVDLLLRLQTQYGYELEVIEKKQYQGREISSSYVREALQQGEMELVERLLGYPYTIQGEVLHGRRIGHTLGMPTTNLIPSVRKLLPPNGVYATKTVWNGTSYSGVTNIGYKPTVGELFRGVETYLFDFDQDLYGQTIAVELYGFERPEQKFEDMEALKAQMHRDIAFGKDYFGDKKC